MRCFPFEAHDAEGEDELGEVAAEDFRSVVRGAQAKVFFGVQAQDEAGAGAACSTGALAGGGLADATDFEGGKACPGRGGGDACEAGVDDGGDAVDGDGGLGDVGGEDDLATRSGLDGAVLLGGCEVAVEWEEIDAEAMGDGRAGVGGTADFCHAGKEDEGVSGGAWDDGAEGVGDLCFEGGGGVGLVLDGEREHASGGVQDGAVAEEGGDGRGVEGGRHDEEFQVGARGVLEAAKQSEREIGVEVALVELVEDDDTDAAECGVGDEAAGEDAFGDEAKAGARAFDLFEADAVADGLAGLLVEFFCDAACGHACGETARFEDDDFAGDVREECGRDAGGFACAGRGFEDEVGGDAEGCQDVRQKIVYGKVGAWGHRLKFFGSDIGARTRTLRLERATC